MSKMYRNREEIREEFIEVFNGKTQLIALSYFDWRPCFEEKYLAAIQMNSDIFAIYKRWVLAQNKMWLPNPEEALVLRAAALSRRDDPTFCSGTVSFDKTIACLIMDIYWPMISASIGSAIVYHTGIKVGKNEVRDLMQNESEFEKAILNALHSSLVCCDEVTASRIYPDFGIALQHLFITFLPNQLEVESLDLSTISDDESFQKAVEEEWVKLLPYADLMFGFSVMPKLGFPDIIRYLRLPRNPAFKKIAKDRQYRDINNYLIFSALVRPQPLPEINLWLRHELVELYRPLIERTLKRKQKSGALKIQSDEICSELMNKLDKYSEEFEPFYASFGGNHMQRGWKPKASWLQQMIAPIGWSGRLVKLGSIFDIKHEYPATAFFSQKISALIDQWFIADEEPSDMTFDDDHHQETAEGTLPDYDFANQDKGENMGWLPRTFAGILGVSYRTLKRWQKDGLLVGRQGDQTYKKFGGGKKHFKYYVKDDLAQAEYAREEKQKAELSGKKLK